MLALETGCVGFSPPYLLIPLGLSEDVYTPHIAIALLLAFLKFTSSVPRDIIKGYLPSPNLGE